MTSTTPLTCDGFANALADYLERDDTPRVRAAVESHAASCAECGALLADLQQLRIDAAGLGTLSPSRDLWAGVAERIATPVIELGRRAGGGGRRAREARRTMARMRPAVAAAALVVVTAGVTYFATSQALRTDRQVAGTDSSMLDPHKTVPAMYDSALRQLAETPTRVERSRSDDATPRTPSGGSAPIGSAAVTEPSRVLPAANQEPLSATLETVYGREIARLRRIIDERRATLDTATVAVIERNLTIIDQAILESRAALTRDPASAFLNEQLNNALERKVELLRAAVLLPVRS